MKNQILRAFSAFVDGRGYAGVADEITPPPLTIKTIEHQSGGMDAALDMDVGMEKLELEFVLSKNDINIQKSLGKSIPFTFKGAQEDHDGNTTQVIINATGKVVMLDAGTWKAGGEAIQLKVKVSLSYYKYTMAGEVIHEIDVENMMRIIDGVDQLSEARAAIGL
ncbi:phage major tail tube protein [Pseudomonas sp. HK3]